MQNSVYYLREEFTIAVTNSTTSSILHLPDQLAIKLDTISAIESILKGHGYEDIQYTFRHDACSYACGNTLDLSEYVVSKEASIDNLIITAIKKEQKIIIDFCRTSTISYPFGDENAKTTAQLILVKINDANSFHLAHYIKRYPLFCFMTAPIITVLFLLWALRCRPEHAVTDLECMYCLLIAFTVVYLMRCKIFILSKKSAAIFTLLDSVPKEIWGAIVGMILTTLFQRLF